MQTAIRKQKTTQKKERHALRFEANDGSDVCEITKDEQTGGLNVDVSIDNRLVTDTRAYIEESVRSVVELPENVVQAGENVAKAGNNLKDAVVNNILGNGKDGVLEDYQGAIRNQELGLQSKIDEGLNEAMRDLGENPEKAEWALEELAKKAVRADGITDGDVDFEFYNAEDGREGGHKDGKIYINLAYQDGTKEKMMEVLGDELSHYVDYRKGRTYDGRRQDISRGYGDDAGSQTMGYIGDEEGDYLGFQERLVELDFSEINREVAKARGLEERRYKVEVDVFIPFEKVGHPENKNPLNEKKYFHGDNRKPFEEGSSRMKQTFIVETDPDKSQNPLLLQNDYQATTILYDDKGNVVDSEKANFEYTSFVIRTDENDGDNVQLSLKGHGKNPLVNYAPAIDYQYQININPGTGDQNSPLIQVSGDHDRFPAHTIQVTDMESGDIYQMHQFVPDSENEVLYLLPIFLNERVGEKSR